MIYLLILRQLALAIFNPVILGLAALIVISAIRKHPIQKRNDFVTAVGYAAFCGLSIQLESLLIRFRPITIDATLLRIDHALGIDPNHFSYWIYTHHYYWFILLLVVYNGLALVIVLTWALEQNLVMRRALMIGAVGCWFFYALFPAVGPLY